MFTQQEESCLLSHWCHHLHTKTSPTTGLSNLFLGFETINGTGCSSRETHCKTSEDCLSMFCHYWSLHIPTIDYSALVFLPYLLPTFTQSGTWGKLPQAPAAPDLWQGIDGTDQPLLPRREPQFCSSCSNQSDNPSHPWCLDFHVLEFIILYFSKLVGPWLLTLRWLTFGWN